MKGHGSCSLWNPGFPEELEEAMQEETRWLSDYWQSSPLCAQEVLAETFWEAAWHHDKGNSKDPLLGDVMKGRRHLQSSGDPPEGGSFLYILYISVHSIFPVSNPNKPRPYCFWCQLSGYPQQNVTCSSWFFLNNWRRDAGSEMPGDKKPVQVI